MAGFPIIFLPIFKLHAWTKSGLTWNDVDTPLKYNQIPSMWLATYFIVLTMYGWGNCTTMAPLPNWWQV